MSRRKLASNEKRSITLVVRINDKESYQLNYICRRTKLTYAEVVRDGIRMQYNLEKTKEGDQKSEK